MSEEAYSDNRGIMQAYTHIVCLAFACHLLFCLVFLYQKVYGMMFYNIGSVIFYLITYILVKKMVFRIATLLVHIEIMLFVIVSTVYLGWNTGFPLYLVALASMLYFNPFSKRYVTYLLSILEAVLFFALKIYCMNFEPILKLGEYSRLFFELLNTLFCFVVIIGGAFIAKVSSDTTEKKLLKKNDSLQHQADHDPLTGLSTRAYLTRHFAEAVSSGVPFSIVMCDLDDFKKMNDTYGHNCGDYILKGISHVIKDTCPANTTITRWGGEEFIIMLYDYGIRESRNLVERIRKNLEAKEFLYETNHLHVTMTFGISTSMETTVMHDLIELADQRLYYGKRHGKNQVVDDCVELDKEPLRNN